MKTRSLGLALCATALAGALIGCGGAKPADEGPAPAAPVEAAPSPAPTTDAAAPAPAAAGLNTSGQLAWDYLFERGIDGWYDNAADKTYGATIKALPGGKAAVTQDGPENWGNVAVVIPNIDFSRNPVLTVDAVDVPAGAGWKVLMTTNPYNDKDLHEVIVPPNTQGDLAKGTGWTGVKKESLLLLVIEGKGKTCTFSGLHINYTK